MLIENKFYRLVQLRTGWRCQEVTDAAAKYDLEYCVNEGLPYKFTIRRFQSGVAFMLYSPHATHANLQKMADRMASTPGR